MKLGPLLLIIGAALMYCQQGDAQVGGQDAYGFLDLSPSARITALGGSLITVRDADPTPALLNPALLNAEMHQSMTFQNNFHFDGIYNGYASYVHRFGESGITGHAGVQFMQYGDFTRADDFGNVLGDFSASDMAVTVGASREFGGMFSAGVNMRFIYSNLDAWQSFAIATDLGGSYWNTEKDIVVSLVIRNVGVQLSSYDEISESVPLDIQVGFSKRLKHLPFRFSIIAHSLNTWNLRYESPLDDQDSGLINEEPSGPSDFSKGVDNFFRHFIFNGEFLLGKKEVVMLRFGYNHQRRKELSLESLRSFAGFSAGVGIRIKQFVIDYGFASYHVAGSTQHVGISTNLGRFGKEEGLLE